MKILQAPYIVPIFMYMPLAMIILCKILMNNQANLTYLGKPSRFISQLFIQACQICFISCFHFWLHRLFEKKLHLPTLSVNTFFIVIYVIMILISLYDFESVRYNLQSVNFSILKAYVPIFRLKDCFSKPIDMVPGDNSEKEVSSLNTVYPLVYDAPVFWLLIIGFFVLFLYFCGLTLFKFRNIIFKSMFTNISSLFDVQYDECKKSYDCVALIKRKYEVYIPENTYSNPFFYTIHILGFLFLFFCLCYN